MKRTILIIVAIVSVAGFASADTSFSLSQNPPAGTATEGTFPDAPNITQNTDPNTLEAGSVACVDSGPPQSSTENHYLRRFFLNADHGIVDPYNVTSVDYGVESATGITVTDIPLNITLYTIASGAAFTFANLTQIGSSSTTIPDGTSLQFFNLPVTGFVDDPIGKDLVVDIWTPDGTIGPDFSLFIGSNALGQTQPAYLAADDCGLPDPATTASIGFPDMHIVMTVNGDLVVGPTPTPPPTGGEPIPTMNRYGIVIMVALLIGVAILVMWRRN